MPQCEKIPLGEKFPDCTAHAGSHRATRYGSKSLMAKQTKSSPSGVKFSNLDKVLFPKAGFTKGEMIRYYVDGGFVQVANNVVSVLTNRALLASVLDRDTAENQLRTALSRTAAGPEELAIRDRLILQARGQLRMASHEG